MRKIEDIFIDFVLSPEYKLQRHLVFILVLASLSTDIAVSQPGFSHSGRGMLPCIVTYNVLVIGMQYLNAQIAVPRWLLKNKFLKYFLFLFSMALLTIGVLFVFQLTFHSLLSNIYKLPLRYLVLNVISSLIIITLLLTGVTTIMLFRYWLQSSRRVTELESATLHSELKYLRNQINPHFLFNTLNNAHALLRDNKKEASLLLYKLEDLLRYQINESSKDSIYLASDINFLTDYLNLEKVRRDRFSFTLAVDGNIEGLQLPPLLFIPFVENAVKHSQDSDHPSYVHVKFALSGKILYFCCENSIPQGAATEERPGGIGLKNIIRRLELLFPNCHQLQLTEKESRYIVELRIASMEYSNSSL